MPRWMAFVTTNLRSHIPVGSVTNVGFKVHFGPKVGRSDDLQNGRGEGFRLLFGRLDGKHKFNAAGKLANPNRA